MNHAEPEGWSPGNERLELTPDNIEHVAAIHEAGHAVAIDRVGATIGFLRLVSIASGWRALCWDHDAEVCQVRSAQRQRRFPGTADQA